MAALEARRARLAKEVMELEDDNDAEDHTDYMEKLPKLVDYIIQVDVQKVAYCLRRRREGKGTYVAVCGAVGWPAVSW